MGSPLASQDPLVSQDRLRGLGSLLSRRGMPADDRTIPLVPALAPALPGQVLRRGSLVAVGGGPGASALALALLAGPLASGSWGAVLGWPELGAEAAAGFGLPLERLALVPAPGPRWWEVAAALLDAVDVVLLGPCSRLAPGLARRLVARARERGGVIVVVTADGTGAAGGHWPEPVDVTLEVECVAWRGIGTGFGTLLSREVRVRASGRRVPATGSGYGVRILLPGSDGTITALPEGEGEWGAAVGPGIAVEQVAAGGPGAAVGPGTATGQRPDVRVVG